MSLLQLGSLRIANSCDTMFGYDFATKARFLVV
jgi:hypothetical protein